MKFKCFWGLLLAACLSFTAAAFEMRAGTAKAILSDPSPRVMVNGRTSAGTLRDIYTRVLTLYDGTHRLIIVANDLNCLDVAMPILRERLQQELNVDPAYLIVLATHNHNAPIQIVPDNFDYGRGLAAIIYQAIQESVHSESGPARLLFGTGPGPEVGVMGAEMRDEEIQVLKVLRGGAPVAMLFSHAAHPLQGSNDLVEPGHPGYAVEEIERRVPGIHALYACAAGGNQFAVRPKTERISMREAREKGPEYIAKQREEAARALGRTLADMALDVTKGSLTDVTGPITAHMEIVSLPLAPPISREEAQALARSFPEGIGFVPYPHEHRGTNWVRMLLRYYDEGLPFPTRTTDMLCTDDTYLIHKDDAELLQQYTGSIHQRFPCVYEEVMVARIGPLAFLAMQGEVTAPIGLRIKELLRPEHPLMLFAYFGEHNLYIPTRAIVEANLYQAKVLQIQYAFPVSWAPEVEDEMVEHTVRIVRQVMRQ